MKVVIIMCCCVESASRPSASVTVNLGGDGEGGGGGVGIDVSSIMGAVREVLKSKGIDFEDMCCGGNNGPGGTSCCDTADDESGARGGKDDSCCCDGDGDGIDGGVDVAAARRRGGSKVKVVCVTPGLKESVEALGQSARGHVVMVRVDDETLKSIDSWVQTGALKSRSEAAALFMREGLKMRADELEKLTGALEEVKAAKAKLRAQAAEVFGDGSGGEGGGDDDSAE